MSKKIFVLIIVKCGGGFLEIVRHVSESTSPH